MADPVTIGTKVTGTGGANAADGQQLDVHSLALEAESFIANTPASAALHWAIVKVGGEERIVVVPKDESAPELKHPSLAKEPKPLGPLNPDTRIMGRLRIRYDGEGTRVLIGAKVLGDGVKGNLKTDIRVDPLTDRDRELFKRLLGNGA